MFESYTEKARRTLGFARSEASAFGSPCIESQHLLLGLLRESKALVKLFPKPDVALDIVRKRIEEHSPVRERHFASYRRATALSSLARGPCEGADAMDSDELLSAFR